MLSREDQNNSSHMSPSCLWMWAEIQEQAQDNTQPAGRGQTHEMWVLGPALSTILSLSHKMTDQ